MKQMYKRGSPIEIVVHRYESDDSKLLFVSPADSEVCEFYKRSWDGSSQKLPHEPHLNNPLLVKWAVKVISSPAVEVLLPGRYYPVRLLRGHLSEDERNQLIAKLRNDLDKYWPIYRANRPLAMSSVPKAELSELGYRGLFIDDVVLYRVPDKERSWRFSKTAFKLSTAVEFAIHILRDKIALNDRSVSMYSIPWLFTNLPYRIGDYSNGSGPITAAEKGRPPDNDLMATKLAAALARRNEPAPIRWIAPDVTPDLASSNETAAEVRAEPPPNREVETEPDPEENFEADEPSAEPPPLKVEGNSGTQDESDAINHALLLLILEKLPLSSVFDIAIEAALNSLGYHYRELGVTPATLDFSSSDEDEEQLRSTLNTLEGELRTHYGMISSARTTLERLREEDGTLTSREQTATEQVREIFERRNRQAETDKSDAELEEEIRRESISLLRKEIETVTAGLATQEQIKKKLFVDQVRADNLLRTRRNK